MNNPIEPTHYKNRYDCITFVRSMNFLQGNAFKYVFRYADKNGREDLLKAKWYLAVCISEQLEGFGTSTPRLCQMLHECTFSETQREALCAIIKHDWNKAISYVDQLLGEYDVR